MSAEGAEHSGGLFNSVKVMLGTLLSIVQTRVELLSTELEEERIRLFSMLWWSLVTLFCALLAVVFITLLFVVALWDSHRLLALGVPAIVFSLITLLAWSVVQGKIRSKPRLFSASLAELAKDREHLTP